MCSILTVIKINWSESPYVYPAPQPSIQFWFFQFLLSEDLLSNSYVLATVADMRESKVSLDVCCTIERGSTEDGVID